MEIYILLALIFMYIITIVIEDDLLIKRIWTLALIMSFVLMGISLIALKLNGEDVMLSAGQFNWYYFLYIFSALSVAIGLINLWIYRRQLWHLCQKDKYESKE